MQTDDAAAAVDEAVRILRLKDLTQDDKKVLTRMKLAGNAFWRPSQIAPGLGLSVIRVRSRLRMLEDAGYVERSITENGYETEFRLTAAGERTLI